MCDGGGGRRRRPGGRRPGYRIKNKNPTQSCGEKTKPSPFTPQKKSKTQGDPGEMLIEAPPAPRKMPWRSRRSWAAAEAPRGCQDRRLMGDLHRRGDV